MEISAASSERAARSLGLRVMMPIFVIMLLLGVGVYFVIYKTVSEFATQRFQEDLERSSREVYGICDAALQNILVSGDIENERAITIKKGKTLGDIENYAQKQQLAVIVFTGTESLLE